MKKFLLLTFLLCLTIALNAQTTIPQGINYQAIVRNSQGAVFVNQPVSARLTILSGSSTGPIQYQETHEVTTNSFGLINLKIGAGTVVQGSFSAIPWEDANQYLKAELAFSGQPYLEIGNSELLSVPFALYARSAGTGGQSGQDGNTILNGTTNPNIATGNIGDFYVNTTTYEIFGPLTAGGWGNGTSLIGPAGANGADGAEGPQGPAGVQGPQGPPGSGGGAAGTIIVAATVAFGAPAIIDPAPTPLGGPGTASAASLWIENNPIYCAVCTQPYAQALPIFSGQAEVIDFPTQTITIASGTNNLGILFMANVTIKSTNNATDFGLANRYSFWVQRSTTADFSANVTNVYRVEDAIASGINNLMNPPVLSSGISNTSIIYPDLNLSPGTYYYRLVYQNVSGSSILQQNIFAQDRSIVLMHINN